MNHKDYVTGFSNTSIYTPLNPPYFFHTSVKQYFNLHFDVCNMALFVIGVVYYSFFYSENQRTFFAN